MNTMTIINYSICGVIILILFIVVLTINSVDNQLRKLNDNFKSTKYVIDHINFCVTEIDTNSIEFKKVYDHNCDWYTSRFERIQMGLSSLDGGKDRIIKLLEAQIEQNSISKINALNDEELVLLVRNSLNGGNK